MKSVFAYGAAMAVITLSAGCASVAVTDDAIEKNTAFALGLEKGDFTISNRQDDGIKSTYAVSTKSGKKFSCYVTGAVSVTGRNVSDAVCSEIGRTGAPAASAPGTCNALLKAAGKCK